MDHKSLPAAPVARCCIAQRPRKLHTAVTSTHPIKCCCRDQSALPPYPIFVFGINLLAAFSWVWQRLHPPALVALNITFGLAKAEVLTAICQLHIAEALAGGPRTAAQLGAELGEYWYLGQE